jgi:hypothetical protein
MKIALLKSADRALARNKKLAYDFFSKLGGQREAPAK